MLLDGQPLRLRLARSLAALLYVAATGSRQPRSSLAAMLWPDLTRERALANLRVVINDLRNHLPDVLEVTRSTIAIADHACEHVDVLRFDALADRALSRSRVVDSDSELATALAVYTGRFLDGFDHDISAEFEQWQVTEETRLRLRAIEVAEALTDTRLRGTPSPQTLTAARRLVELDPLGEAAMERLMRAHWRRGDRVAALGAFHQWSERFRHELGIPVSADLQGLADQIRQDGVDGSLHRTPSTRIPAGVKDLVARQEDLDHLTATLDSGRHQLVTLTGPAGTGKTSLTLAACHLLRRERPQPMVYVDLVPVAPGQLPQALADAINEDVVTSAAATSHDAEVHGLLVLDNFEHLLDEREAVTDLLRRHPAVRVLITSRRALRVPDELVIELSPLPVPPPGCDPQAARRHGAIELFLSRAQQAGTSITPTPENLALASAICSAVDGLPLGIELVVPRIRMFGLAGLAHSLSDQGMRVQFDSRSAVDQEQRQGTVDGAVAWSAGLLAPSSQAALRTLSVFEGTFGIPAALAVLDAEGGEAGAVDIVAELIDFHLVERDQCSGPSPRLRLLDTTRAWAAAALADTGEAESARQRHAEYYLGTAEATLNSSPAQRWRDRVADLANVSAAARWLARHDRQDDAHRLLTEVGPAWRYAGLIRQGLDLHATVAGGSDRAAQAACAIWRAGLLAEERGRTAAAAVSDLIQENLDAIHPERHRLTRARCLAESVRALSYVGRNLEALTLAEQQAEYASEPAEQQLLLGTRWETAWMAHREGNNRRALKILRDLLTDSIALGNRRVELYCWMLAELCGAKRDDLAVTPRSLHELLDLSLEVDDRRYTTWLLVSLGAVATIEQRLNEATHHFIAAHALASEAGYDVGLGFCLLGVVGIRAFSGDMATAARLHGAVTPHLPELYQVLPRAYRTAYEGVIELLDAAAVDDTDVARARAEGAKLTLHEASAEAHTLLTSR